MMHNKKFAVALKPFVFNLFIGRNMILGGNSIDWKTESDRFVENEPERNISAQRAVPTKLPQRFRAPMKGI